MNKIAEPIKLKAATRVTLEDGDNSGELTIRFKKPRGTTGFLYQYSIDATLSDKSWVSFSGTTSTYTFTGLTKGVTYYCRVISLSPNQQEMISIVVNLVSQ